MNAAQRRSCVKPIFGGPGPPQPASSTKNTGTCKLESEFKKAKTKKTNKGKGTNKGEGRGKDKESKQSRKAKTKARTLLRKAHLRRKLGPPQPASSTKHSGTSKPESKFKKRTPMVHRVCPLVPSSCPLVARNRDGGCGGWPPHSVT